MKKIAIIGAGPAGLAAAWRLAGKKGVKVMLIDQGRSAFQRVCPSPSKCVKCPLCNKSSGIGGAGTFSDGKFTFETIIGKRTVGSNLFEDIGVEKENFYMKEAKNFFSSCGLKIKSPDPEKLNRAREIEIIASRNDMDYIFACQTHVGTDRLPAFIDRIEKNLKKKGVEIVTQENVLSFDGKEVHTAKRTIPFDFLIVAPGRKGASWLEEQMKKNSIQYHYRAVDIGFRIETDANVTRRLANVARDIKLSMIIPSHGNIIRTFCVCPNGMVTRETYDGFNLVNGASDSKSLSQNTNFALLISIPLDKVNSNDYGDAIAKLFHRTGTDKPVLQQLGDIKRGSRSREGKLYEWRIQPTLKDVHIGDVGWAMPYNIQKRLLEAIDRLSSPGLMEGLNNDSTLIYGPEMKRNGLNVMTDKHLRTTIPQIRVAGDGPGKSRSIVGAAASGILAADGILSELC